MFIMGLKMFRMGFNVCERGMWADVNHQPCPLQSVYMFVQLLVVSETATA